MSIVNDSKEEFVRNSFFSFVKQHIGDANLSVIDDILVSYIVGILEEIASQGYAKDAFDVDYFTEMMSAYLPQFVEINSADITQWMLDHSSSLTKSQIGESNGAMVSIEQDLTTDLIKVEENSSVTKYLDDEAQDVVAEADNSGLEDAEISLLREMFPTACTLEIMHCLSIGEGNTEKAAQLILHRQEAGESLTASVPRQAQKPIFKKEQNDNELRQHILSRYMYVDQLDDKREHKPVAPKWEPKKLVRYRDNQIVSLKGEKYTEVHSPETDELKKTYVALKPARQYRFH